MASLMRAPGRFAIGDQIQGRYEVRNVLQGGMGVVYAVYDHATGQPYAVKTFKEAVTPEVALRFALEALAWIRLDCHENVTRAHFVERSDGTPLLFLEYVSGGDLARWIGTPRLTGNLRLSLRFAIQFCDGMVHAASKGLKAHRDIKPQNCLVSQGPVLKITDFGLAKTVGAAGASGDSDTESPAEATMEGHGSDPMATMTLVLGGGAVTRTGMGFGTITHMAPEQFDDAKRVDVRADVYSFGVMLYQMLAGELPFLGRTVGEFRNLHRSQPPPACSVGNQALENLVRRCLAKRCDERPADFGRLRAELADIHLQVTGDPPPEPLTGAKLGAAEWSNKGSSLSNLGRHAEALACFDEALKLHPSLGEAWANKGRVLVELGRLDGAMDCFEEALRLNPRDGKAVSDKAAALATLRRDPEALALCDQALALDPLLEQGWTNKGAVLRRLGRLEEAAGCHARAIELNPRLAGAWSNRGAVLRTLGRHLEALGCYDRAIGLEPAAVEAWYNKGTALSRLGRQAEAILVFDRALGLDPGNGRIWANKAAALSASGRAAEALACCEKAIELAPTAPEAWFNKGSILLDAGRAAEALGCFQEARRLGLAQAEHGIAASRKILNGRNAS